jgi:hypothetical protein
MLDQAGVPELTVVAKHIDVVQEELVGIVQFLGAGECAILMLKDVAQFLLETRFFLWCWWATWWGRRWLRPPLCRYGFGFV